MTQFNKQNPFTSKVLDRSLLSKPGSSKATYHLSLSIEGSGMTYRPGDTIGVYPCNDTETVSRILSLLKEDGHRIVFDPRSQSEITLSHFLTSKVNLKRVSSQFLEKICGITFDSPTERIAFINAHDIEGSLEKFPPLPGWQEHLASCVAPLLPRFYSIASSPKAYPNQIHLLIATFTYELGGKLHTGACSDFLCRKETNSAQIYIHPTENFLLPEKSDTPIVMIGPGTGLAPFKGFIEERISSKEKAPMWLFFGECNRAYDYYYEDLLSGSEHLRLSLAFSRDQLEKVYVQHKMQEEASLLYEWIVGGAYLYICGDAKRMAKDVVTTLHEIMEQQGNLSEKDAKDYIKQMRAEKRLLMDVY